MSNCYLHLGNVRVGRGLSIMLVGDTRLFLTQLLAGGVVGLIGHFGGIEGSVRNEVFANNG